MKKSIQVLLISVLTLALLVIAGCASKEAPATSESPSPSAEPSSAVSQGTQPDVSDAASEEPSAEVSAGASSEPSTKPTASSKPSPGADSSHGKDYDSLGAAILDNDGLGSMKLRMGAADLVKLMGEPDSKGDPEIWGADGLEHSDWSYDSKGLIIGMAKQPDDTEAFIFSLNATAPCELATKRGIKIGDSKDEVLSAYKNEIDPAANEDTDSWIVAGSIYGGIGFGIEDGVVTYIFLGASAE